MKRRAFIALFSSAAVLPLAVAAQTPPRTPRVVFLRAQLGRIAAKTQSAGLRGRANNCAGGPLGRGAP